MRNWIVITAIAFFSLSWTYPVNKGYADLGVLKELPVMRVNVYMMGREVVDEEITKKIYENIVYLNETFQGEITFIFDELFMDPNHAYLPDIYQSFRADRQDIVDPLVNQIEKKGAINVFLFDTYCEEGQNAALMGFTPLLRDRQAAYARVTPKYDRILMAYEGLEENKTLVHEMGHFFGLQHPWEMSQIARYRLGIRNHTEEAHNHMSYGNEVEKFTAQQLADMRSYALKYRTYLMEKVIRVYARA